MVDEVKNKSKDEVVLVSKTALMQLFGEAFKDSSFFLKVSQTPEPQRSYVKGFNDAVNFLAFQVREMPAFVKPVEEVKTEEVKEA